MESWTLLHCWVRPCASLFPLPSCTPNSWRTSVQSHDVVDLTLKTVPSYTEPQLAENVRNF